MKGHCKFLLVFFDLFYSEICKLVGQFFVFRKFVVDAKIVANFELYLELSSPQVLFFVQILFC